MTFVLGSCNSSVLSVLFLNCCQLALRMSWTSPIMSVLWASLSLIQIQCLFYVCSPMNWWVKAVFSDCSNTRYDCEQCQADKQENKIKEPDFSAMYSFQSLCDCCSKSSSCTSFLQGSLLEATSLIPWISFSFPKIFLKTLSQIRLLDMLTVELYVVRKRTIDCSLFAIRKYCF